MCPCFTNETHFLEFWDNPLMITLSLLGKESFVSHTTIGIVIYK